ncbi:MAG: hypothetical protein QOG83_875 [Alphaproteobacteria bacterium]|jgi:hypothetical protein|nr:hypothetical protein [Alphaproteobacteria bacterium]MEA2988164.1 hypothetical protein [Alphaproteobacteria bacterium]
MSLRIMIAALTLAGAASFVAAPSFAQDYKVSNETAPRQSGAMPIPSLQSGKKGEATVQADTTASGDTKKMMLEPSGRVGPDGKK